MSHLQDLGIVISPAQHPNWIAFVIASAFAVGATIAAIRVWNGEPVNRRNSMAQEEGLSVLKVTMAPTAVGFWALGLGILALNLGGGLAHPSVTGCSWSSAT